ncbi:SDR family oxidoreductase [Rubellicoccus peritrichatus]|uniref:SDR family oxidoreductase n=1 Tax=Rubellicoccus peritrichatus TaxID=3080537 RepID=A0AAQ3LBX8_9BACT|nr:SDR family oxidoreductase [Puniceicoccus sp. CR14]WOO42936.1 SDR family oxidoreductase [Puniceicoccus sp. CR14]
MIKSAIITGTRKGLGKAAAEHFLENGWRVAGCSRKPGSIEHESYSHFELDVGDERAVGKMIWQVSRTHKSVDLLINNAGIASMNHCITTPLTTGRSLMETNVLGSFSFLREVAKVMRRGGGGRIINLSSVAVPLALEGEALYAASKAAVEALTRVTAKELAPWNITVNAIGPGPIKTSLIAGVPKERIEDLIEQQTIKRLGTPADVINAIDFFVRPESDFVTGQVLYLGGAY